MSGAAGGVTINKEDLKATIRDYRENVLKPLNLDKSYNITGIRRRPEKNVFGDIDIVISFPGGDKKDLKQEFAKHLSQIDKIPTIPHKKNLKYFIHGSIVTNLYPIIGKEGQYVQIDNIVTASEDEGKFTYSMLDLPAQEQGLALGLAKTVFTELNDNQIKQLFKDLNIPQDIETPGEGEEYDFNLNTSELSLRIVPIGQGGGREIWKSTKFSDIQTLLKSLGINIEKDKFEDMIQVIKKFKNRRSIERLKGMFTKNIRVGDAEVGRDKGIAKQKSIDTVSNLEEKYNPLVMSLITPLILEMEDKSSIAVFPGKFKPPHKDHLARIQAASKAVGPLGTVKILIGPKSSNPDPNQETITADQSLAIFNLYKDKGLLPDNVEFQISPDPSPVLSAYKEFEKNKDKSPEEQQPYIAVFGKEEASRFAGISKIPNITINDFPEANVGNESATNIRVALKNDEDISKFLPKGINAEEYKQALNIDSSINELVTQSEIDDVERIADEWFEEYGIDIKFTRHFIERVNDVRNGKPISVEELEDIFTKTAEKYGEKLANLPDDFQAVLHSLRTDINLPFVINYDEKNDEVDLVAKTIMRKRNFQTSNPKLTLQEIYAEPSEYDYPKLIKSLTEYMINQGMELKPLPKVKFIKNDIENARNFFGKTAYYDPNQRIIVLYTMDRHPKDVMRSFAHEMIHHMQNCENRLDTISTDNTNEDGALPEIEKEAYEKGNMTFRNWEDSIKNPPLQLNEGKYDKISNTISSNIFNQWKQDFGDGKIESLYQEYMETPSLNFDVIAVLKFINEGESLEFDGELEETEDGNTIYINFKVDRNTLPEMWSEISMNLKDTIRHEIEHLTQSDIERYPSKYMEDDQLIRDLINSKLLSPSQYFKLEKEIDANLQGMYFRAKKEKRPFIDVIDDYLSRQDITPEQKKEIIDLWRTRSKALSLPKF
jgi:nicotinic acid mononucleotide adenylyltransferase